MQAEFLETTISASKFAEPRWDIPQQITTISQAKIARLNPLTTADALAQTGQIHVQKSQQGGGSPILRGFEANKVLLVIDGVRLNNAIYRGGHLQNIITTDPAALQRIEVIFGPASVVYGSDALGGVIHLHTLAPRLRAPAQKPLSGGAYLRHATANRGTTAHLHLHAAGHRLASVTSLTLNTFNNLRAGRNRNPAYGTWGLRPWSVQHLAGRDTLLPNPDTTLQLSSAYSQLDALQKVLFRHTSRAHSLLNIQFSTSTNIPRYDRLTEQRNNAPRFAEWYYGPQHRLMAAYTFTHTAAPAYDELRITAAYQDLRESRHDRAYRSPFLNQRHEALDILSLNADAAKHWPGHLTTHELRYGAEWFWNHVASTAQQQHIYTQTLSPLDTRYPDGGSTLQNAALYATHACELRPQGKLILTDGIRASLSSLSAAFQDTTFFPFPYQTAAQRHPALTGNIGIVAFFTPRWRVAALASTGFRVPNVDDMAKVFDSAPGLLVVPNPNLRPEHTYNIETSLTHFILPDPAQYTQNHLTLTLFYTQYQNVISLQPFTLHGSDSILYAGQMSQVVANQNAESAYLMGLNATYQQAITPHLAASGTLTHTYARIHTPTGQMPLDHIPPLYGRFGVVYLRGRLRAEIETVFNGWKRLANYRPLGEDNLQYATPHGTPAWNVLNLRTAYHLNARLRLQAACENLADIHYRTFASGISAPGRNLLVSIHTDF